jgi:hypothetical protein
LTAPDGQSTPSNQARIQFGVVRRKPRPGELDEPSSRADTPQPEPAPTPEAPSVPEPAPAPDVSEPETPAAPTAPAEEPEGVPDPIGGQPAHWARVADLNPGDMVRVTGRTRNGRRTERAGFAYTGPVRVEVTRNGRAEEMGDRESGRHRPGRQRLHAA